MVQENSVALSYGYRNSGSENVIYDVSPPYIGIHTHSAFYAMIGPKINHIDMPPVIFKEDILINILYLLGIPISSGLDGKIYNRFFYDRKDLKYIKEYTFLEDSTDYTDDLEQDIIIEQIKNMGYMR